MTPRPGARSPRHIRAFSVVAAVCAVAALSSSCSTRPSDTGFTGPTVFSPRSPSPVAASSGPEYQTDIPTASPELYKQALDVYYIYFAQESAMEMQGGGDQLTPQLAAVVTGDAETKVTQTLQQAKKLGIHWVGSPQFTPFKIAQLMTYVPRGTVIGLQACEVTSGAKLLQADGTELADGSPVMVLHRYYLRYNDQHQLVIYDVNGGTERLDTCPIS